PYWEWFGIKADVVVSSAHRSPERTSQIAREARQQGYGVIICAAGMAAHLPGVVASLTDLPVIGVPLEGGVMGGLDALLSIVQMPAGVPVGTMAVGKAGAINAVLLSARIFSLTDVSIASKLRDFIANGCRLPN
ncbi:MAG: 5-(carboxyamino)imidazole ribonucleotide mutase, partial [bacterium]